MATVPRPSSSLVAFWAVAAVGALFLGDSVVRGNWHVFLLTVGPVALVVWAAWMFLYRPRVSFDADHLMVINPGRVIEVPWQRVSAVRQRFQILLDLDDGSTLTCWGSPFPEKPGRSRPAPASSRASGGEFIGPLDSARARAEGRTSVAKVERRWDLRPLAIGVILVIVCVAELTSAR
jgi:hypothetical protein